MYSMGKIVHIRRGNWSGVELFGITYLSLGTEFCISDDYEKESVRVSDFLIVMHLSVLPMRIFGL